MHIAARSPAVSRDEQQRRDYIVRFSTFLFSIDITERDRLPLLARLALIECQWFEHPIAWLNEFGEVVSRITVGTDDFSAARCIQLATV
ncbi:hypothetical protein JYK14_01370 [Siccirubricoccus sp. KC 17139]|uniref:Uncharacterized protein n=1 Tax=Siccirubricoccus soli TaxID=2899147 RepID=A0ABT1CYU5_9PROT|nr:hypothetical protein [Siccirubricoccus soli]MCO6414830.1 hypothetical protein [Siccirubricoccus soli]MCP2680960.1 hypothetical protein [Siccirubricoccus soli]